MFAKKTPHIWSPAIHRLNPHIKQFLPFVQASLIRGLTAFQNKEKTYRASKVEWYAQRVQARTAEIDNCFAGMRLSLEYLRMRDYPNSEHLFSVHHAFHAENFLLRLTGVVDRSYLLAGTTIGMKDRDIENLGGKKRILRKLSTMSPSSCDVLARMEAACEPLRRARNKVAHQAGFSARHLVLLQSIESLEARSHPITQLTDLVPYEDIQDAVLAESFDQFEPVTVTLDGLVKDLIDSFSRLYSCALGSAGSCI